MHDVSLGWGQRWNLTWAWGNGSLNPQDMSTMILKFQCVSRVAPLLHLVASISCRQVRWGGASEAAQGGCWPAPLARHGPCAREGAHCDLQSWQGNGCSTGKLQPVLAGHGLRLRMTLVLLLLGPLSPQEAPTIPNYSQVKKKHQQIRIMKPNHALTGFMHKNQ